MTRYTNFARPKRTYVEAGFNDDPSVRNGVVAPRSENPSAETFEPDYAKKRKRARQKKIGHPGVGTRDNGESSQVEFGDPERPAKRVKKNKDGDHGEGRSQDAGTHQFASERPRRKRIDDRNANTTCLACRDKGHLAQNCRKVLASDASDGKKGAKSGRDAVGICYRPISCGSRRHTLSRCKKPVDSSNPLPFASCFVCAMTGHLASGCPKNQFGIYPKGGCCNLCKKTTHLARDCDLRKQGVASNTLFVGTGQEGGADEDDFHTFKRKSAEVDKVTKVEEKTKRNAEVRVGAYSGAVKAFGDGPLQKKKVVVF